MTAEEFVNNKLSNKKYTQFVMYRERAIEWLNEYRNETLEDVKEIIPTHMPVLVRPVRKANTTYVAAFSSNNAQDVVVESLIESIDKLKK